MKSAIFLDRDGVINQNRTDYVKSINELKIFPTIAKTIKNFKNYGYIVIVITNQSAVNRGLVTHDDVKKIHKTIQTYLKKNGTYIDAFYYCPHRPDEGCNCRKPKPGMILKAINDFNLDAKSSWMIGDSDSDVLAGKSAGINTIKVDGLVNTPSVMKKILSSRIEK